MVANETALPSKLAVSKFKFVIEIVLADAVTIKEPVIIAKLAFLLSCEDAVAIKEPVIVANEIALLSKLAVTLPTVANLLSKDDAEEINEPLTTPISVNLESYDAVTFSNVANLLSWEDAVEIKEPVIVAKLAFLLSKDDAELIKEPVMVANAVALVSNDADVVSNDVTLWFKAVISTPFTLPVNDALTEFTHNVLHFAPVVPKSNVPFVPGTKFVVKTPGTLILSPDVLPKNKLPETVKFPLTNILDALTSPDK